MLTHTSRENAGKSPHKTSPQRPIFHIRKTSCKPGTGSCVMCRPRLRSTMFVKPEFTWSFGVLTNPILTGNKSASTSTQAENGPNLKNLDFHAHNWPYLFYICHCLGCGVEGQHKAYLFSYKKKNHTHVIVCFLWKLSFTVLLLIEFQFSQGIDICVFK